METTDGLKLNITTESSFEDDDIKNTIVEYGNNFSKLEKYLKDSTQSIEDLGDNKYYQLVILCGIRSLPQVHISAGLSQEKVFKQKNGCQIKITVLAI